MFRFYFAIFMIAVITAGATASDGAERPERLTEIYRLGSGDRVKVTVYGETDLSGVFEVSGTGAIAYPLIGEISAGGRTIRELETVLVERLRDGYLRKPKVNVEVTNYRPFYIIGEVNRPGSYAFVEGMTVVKAVAMSGGYTYRAREDRFFVRRVGDPKDKETEASPADLVHPGDVLRVPERYF